MKPLRAYQNGDTASSTQLLVSHSAGINPDNFSPRIDWKGENYSVFRPYPCPAQPLEAITIERKEITGAQVLEVGSGGEWRRSSHTDHSPSRTLPYH